MFSHDKQQLLADSEVDDFALDEDALSSSRFKSQKGYYGRFALLFLLFLSVLLNLGMVFASWQKAKAADSKTSQQRRVSYSGLQYDVPTTYSFHTDYWPESGILSDEKWEAISIDPAVIAVTPEWAEERGLPWSWEFPWDPSKRLYFIKVFHQLHCLKSFRRAFQEYEKHGVSSLPHGHIAHCLDSLRQDLMCYADDTPMPSPNLNDTLGDGQVNKCMDFQKLSEWALHPDRHACHKHVAEYVPIKHPVERFAFCPPDSPYYPAMNAYFEKHGHLNPAS